MDWSPGGAFYMIIKSLLNSSRLLYKISGSFFKGKTYPTSHNLEIMT